MPLTFPSSPINGAVSGDYTYDATKGAWRKNAAYPVSVTHSDVAPSNPRVGDQWWKSNEGTLFTYYNDGTSSQWVESTNVVANVEPNPIPAGAMMAWGSDVIPANWLLCDGSAVSRSTYASLFAIIGTQYGAGDGVTTFNLPNIKGRTIVGKDASQTEFDVLGELGGAKTHTLTIAEMPSHTHGTSSHTHSFSATSSSSGSHYHRVYTEYGATPNSSYPPPNANYLQVAGPNAGTRSLVTNSTETTGSHTHTVSGTTGSAAPDTTSVGSDGAHNNLQPYIVLNYIIKFSAGETPGDSQLATRVGTLETQNNATPLGQNYIINGAFDVWQRGTSFTTTASAAFTADRWYANVGAGATIVTSQQSFTPGSAPTSGYEGLYYCRVNRTVTGSAASYFTYKIEDVRTISNKTITLSFWAKASANMAIGAGEIYFWNVYGTGGSSATGQGINTATSITTSWQRFSYTITTPSLAGKTVGANSYSELAFYLPTSLSTFTLDIWGVQVEDGSYATPFRRNGSSTQAELAACQRYYYQSAQSYGFYNIFNSGNMQSSTFRFPVTMRISTPAVTVYDNAGTVNKITIANAGGTSQNGITPPATIQYTADGFMWVAGGMGGTVGNNGMVYMSKYEASAEL